MKEEKQSAEKEKRVPNASLFSGFGAPDLAAE